MARKKGHGDRAARADGVQRARQAARRSDDGNAFLPDPDGGPIYTPDDLAEVLAEDFILSATTNVDADAEEHEEVVEEELGGPFIETTGREEFAAGTDESNPEDATPEPLPRVMGGPPHEPNL